MGMFDKLRNAVTESVKVRIVEPRASVNLGAPTMRYVVELTCVRDCTVERVELELKSYDDPDAPGETGRTQRSRERLAGFTMREGEVRELVGEMGIGELQSLGGMVGGRAGGFLGRAEGALEGLNRISGDRTEYTFEVNAHTQGSVNPGDEKVRLRPEFG